MRTEEIVIRKGNPLFEAMASACFHGRCLYNQANYIWRQNFFRGKRCTWAEIDKELKASPDSHYRKLPGAAGAQNLIKTLGNNWTGFWGSLKKYAAHPEEFEERPKPPSYCRGKKTLVIQRNGFKVEDGILTISGIGSLPIKCIQNQPFNQKASLSRLQEIRIIPANGSFLLHLSYKEEPKKDCRTAGLSQARILGADFGATNLVTMIAIGPDTESLCPLICKGGYVKAKNQLWNKQSADLKRRGKHRHIKSKSVKRYLGIKNELHCVSKFIVEYCLDHGIGRICLGHNPGWKQNANMGKRNNQNFVQIPHSKLIKMIQYKAQAYGIEVYLVDEAYTSQSSALDLDPLPSYEEGQIKKPKFSGRRICRGLYQASGNRLLNADVQAALNIARKEFPNEFRDALPGLTVGGRVYRPRVVTLKSKENLSAGF